MSGETVIEAPPLTRDALAAELEAGCRPAAAFKLGTEHEKFPFDKVSLKPLPYAGTQSVRAILDGVMARHPSFVPIFEGENIVALKCEASGASITLEPGGQLELSGAQLSTVFETCAETRSHHRMMNTVGEPLNIGFLGVGFAPTWRRQDMHWMPKARYRIMRDHMPRVGDLGLDMMTRTCTVQVNLDFSSEADMVKKFRVALALQSLATALFANSPFTEGAPNGYLSYRAHIWTRTDPHRSGFLDFVFQDGMGFERYVDYLLDVPMYYVYRDNRYIDAAGQSFRDFMEGRLEARPGERATLDDWRHQITFAFPDVRLKRFIEMRGADGGEWNNLCALPAFWAGLLYDGEALDAAYDLISSWSVADMRATAAEVPRLGLQARGPGPDFLNLQALGEEVLRIAELGLQKRGYRNDSGDDERVFLAPLQAAVEQGTVPAQWALDSFYERWQGQLRPLFEEQAY